uniref:Uncharacterized protein n=1 Tax=Cacopsylla melanoneura TaxID=428564 RepID=A0A8D8XV06_9HEMI
MGVPSPQHSLTYTLCMHSRIHPCSSQEVNPYHFGSSPPRTPSCIIMFGFCSQVNPYRFGSSLPRTPSCITLHPRTAAICRTQTKCPGRGLLWLRNTATHYPP